MSGNVENQEYFLKNSKSEHKLFLMFLSLQDRNSSWNNAIDGADYHSREFKDCFMVLLFPFVDSSFSRLAIVLLPSTKCHHDQKRYGFTLRRWQNNT